MDVPKAHVFLSFADIHVFSERLTAYGDVTFSASEARRIVSDLKHLHETLEKQAAMTKELLVYLDRAIRSESLLRRTLPALNKDVSPEGLALLEEVGTALSTLP